MVILYIFLLILQLTLLILSIRQRAIGYRLTSLIASLLSAALCWGLGTYYDHLPGYGFMPGLTYFAETLFSYGAAIISLGIAALSAILWIVLKKKN